jgi:phosphoribosylaminoimidazole-succinocarboxamide synthase
MAPLSKMELEGFPLFSRGKVRDMFAVDAETLLIVTTDRMSAFDVPLREPVPGKGQVLNCLTLFWMRRFASLAPNHILEDDFSRFPASLRRYPELAGRSVLARRARPLPVECVVRGHLAGSGWEEYRKNGTVCGLPLPAGLCESSRLPAPLFTPSTKAEAGLHDENITQARCAEILGAELFRRVRDLSLALFSAGRDYAETRGIIIADTKFEFGFCGDELLLIDEVLTPDSSRFWPLAGYAPGRAQPSFDKQYLRDWLAVRPWDKTPPAPALPEEIVAGTSARYREAYAILTGETI